MQLRDERKTRLGDLASWNPARPGVTVRSAEILVERGLVESGSTVTAEEPRVAADRSSDTIKLTEQGQAVAGPL